MTTYLKNMFKDCLNNYDCKDSSQCAMCQAFVPLDVHYPDEACEPTESWDVDNCSKCGALTDNLSVYCTPCEIAMEEAHDEQELNRAINEPF